MKVIMEDYEQIEKIFNNIDKMVDMSYMKDDDLTEEGRMTYLQTIIDLCRDSVLSKMEVV